MKPIVVFLLFLTTTVKAQESIFLSPDSVANCSILLSGAFKSSNTNLRDYRMEVENNVVTEYVSEGKYYVRSKVEYIDKCSYKSTITEVTIPHYNIEIGATMFTQILETQCYFIKIRSKIGNQETVTVLEKIE
jgi:hypothetical protein